MADGPDTPSPGGKAAGGLNLGKKLGPLPVGVWLLAIAGGLVIAFMVRRRATAAEDPEVLRDTSTTPGIGAAAGYGGDQIGSATRPSTNEDWYRLAVNTILGLHMGYDAGLVDLALRKYINGQALTEAEQAIVTRAIQLIGPPPYPLPPPPPIPEPEPEPEQPQQPSDPDGDADGNGLPDWLDALLGDAVEVTHAPGADPPGVSWDDWSFPSSGAGVIIVDPPSAPVKPATPAAPAAPVKPATPAAPAKTTTKKTTTKKTSTTGSVGKSL